MGSRLQIPIEDSVLLRVTHSNLKSFSADVRFSPEMTVESVKEKLWKKCGTSVDSMRIELYDDVGVKVCDLDDNFRPLGFYSPQTGCSSIDTPRDASLLLAAPARGSSSLLLLAVPRCSTIEERFRLHIIDLDPSSVSSGGWLEDTSLVEKYTISEEAYDKLDCNFRKFKEKIASQNPSVPENKLSDKYMEDLCKNIKLGDRCEVEPGAKRGVIKFVGEADTVAPGFWVGVHLDEPLGKNDGVVKGKRYFTCPPQHGTLVRPDRVKVGNYPERDPFEDEEI